jgi:hypothetical protein
MDIRSTMNSMSANRSGPDWTCARALALPVACALAVSIAAATAPNPPVPGPGQVDFNHQIRPLLSSQCFTCHGPDEGSRKARLRLDVRDDAIRDRGGIHAILPGDADNSEVLLRVLSTDPREVMPPPKHGRPLSPDESDLLRRWIDEGAVYAEHWAWARPQRPHSPAVSRPDWPRNAVDQFVLARLDQEQLAPARAADPHALIRRVAIDLTGLPPTPEQVREFIEDQEPEAYERMVDRFLASPAYGERWARVWLDLARYADSAGYGSDPLRPNIWPWRDWVIEALNRNLPYDQFTIKQLAGDLLPDPTEAQRVATAFHRNTMTNTEGGTDDEEYRVAAVKDRANVTGQVWMGLTVGCAECHSHKFDPLSHREYYQWFAFFNQTEDNDQPDERPTLPLPNAEQRTEMDRLRPQISGLESELNQSTPAFEADLAAWEERQADGLPWTPLAPLRSWSMQGSLLQRLPDHSLLATGASPEIDLYVSHSPIDLPRLTALRLELLPHVSLPEGGPGRAPGNGKAVLTEIEAAVRAPGQTPPRARYVRVELPGPHRVLSLAEVQVYDAATNLARSGVATQSSTAETGEAQRAIDGLTTGDFDHGSTTLTEAEDHPWWEVDLGAEHPLESVVVWNRTDAGLGTRLTDFRVRALDATRQPVWEQSVGPAPNPVRSFRLPPETVLKLRHASASAAESGFPAARAIDGNFDGRNGWGVPGDSTLVHAASFEVEGAPMLEPGSVLVVSLTQRHGQQHTVGRFRISATTAPHPVRELPRTLRQILALPREARTDAQQTDVAAFFREFAPSLDGLRHDLAGARRALGNLQPVALPIMKELPPDQRRVTRILNAGNFLDPGDPVEAGVPEAFHPLPADAPANRLGLAQWLVSSDNPLTARVAVNRWWSQLFGAGLVETEEDFGTQGSLPTHPELLDWLAVELMESGWDMKHLLRILVTSATYRQSARVTTELLERDPRNRLYARGPRQRLEAEMIRDQALALAGLLSPKQGGPSVFPPQPDGLWRAAFNAERTYHTSQGEDRYRRGLYTFWRRTVPYPSMAAFDAPSREQCTVRRLPTNTPLQALVTLNDPVYVEAAQALGRRIVQEGGPSVADRVRFGLELALARPATPEAIAILTHLYEQEHAHHRTRPEEALQLATDPLGPLPEGWDPAEAAAWTAVGNALLNLDAVLTRG